MDAKYNYIIDSVKWRILLNLAGFWSVAGSERGLAAPDLTKRADHYVKRSFLRGRTCVSGGLSFPRLRCVQYTTRNANRSA
jgi:hypothetical protein